LKKAIYRNHQDDGRNNSNPLNKSGSTNEEYEEIMITDDQDPSGNNKKAVKIPANRRQSALDIIAKLHAAGQEIDVNLLKSILNLNDIEGSNLNRVIIFFISINLKSFLIKLI